MHDEDRLDRMLESSLSSYGDPGTDSGLAERILARVRSERMSPVPVAIGPRVRPFWVVALAAACLLFVFFGLRTWGPQSVHPSRQLQTPPTTSAKVEQATPRHRSSAIQRPQTHIRPSLAAAKHASPPKLDQFPQPQALSPEEQALYAFATQVPEKQRQAILEAQKKVDAPLNIAAIHIQPLEITDTGKN